MAMLEITLKKGLVGKPASQRRVVHALGLTKYGSSVKHSKSATILGMVEKVHHLVAVTESNEKHSEKAKAKTSKASVKPSKTKVK